jgi:hypothetical protein
MQYFRAVNVTKKEVVCPWCLGNDADSPEWSTNILGAICLLQQPRTKDGACDNDSGLSLLVDPSLEEHFERAMRKGIPKVLKKIDMELELIAARWAGDEVYLVGSPEREEYQDSFGYRNISQEVATAWNDIVDDEDMHLQYQPDCVCEPVAETVA